MSEPKSDFVPTPEMLRENEEFLRKQAEYKAQHPEHQEPHAITINFHTEKIKAMMEAHKKKFTPIIRRAPAIVNCAEYGHEGEVCHIDFEATLMASYAPDQLRLVYDGCTLCKQAALVNEKCRKWIQQGVPFKTAHATFDNYLTGSDKQKIEAVKMVERQVKRRKGFLLLFGKYGNGKTHLASAAFKAMGGGIFVTFGDLIGQLRQCYDEGGQEKLVKRYQQVENLVLDEVELLKGKGTSEIQSADIQPFLYRIFAYRFDRDKFSILTSNEDLATLLKILGPRLEDRMAQNYTSISFTWDSYRRANRAT